MRILHTQETNAVSGADMYFKVVIDTNPTASCAAFLKKLFVRYITGEIESDKLVSEVYHSSFFTEDIELAYQGLNIEYYKD